MNNKHILDLTLRLSQALDQNYDVVSMETVLSVISALEGTTITKEQLEATRLAKYINQLRRRTKCEKLARRAKSLLKRWREMVGMQQSNESAVSCVSNMTAASAINSSSTATAPFNIPSSDNAVSTSHLITQQLSQQHYQRQLQYQTMFKQHQMQQQPYHSQPSSPVNHQEKSNHHEFFISISNPATGAQMPKSSNANLSKKIRCEKNISNDPNGQQQQQPTSFANLISGLGNTLESTRRTTMEKTEPATSTFKAVETFIIEHSSNSNSDLICIPTNNTVSSNFTSATDVPPVVIDLQDTNSSINSLVSKDVANASSSFYRNKISARKLKKEKKRRDRNVTTLQNLPLQDCDDHNTTTASYHLKRPSDVLLLDEKSHSACPTISNISEILSLSNSSMSSVFPPADAMSKNIFQSGQNELVSSPAEMTKSDLTFAGKFKQTTSSTSAGLNVSNYNSDSTNVNILNQNSPNRNKISLFGGIEATISNDSSSSSRTTPFHDVVIAVKGEASNSRQNIEDVVDNAIAVDASAIPGAASVDFSSQQIVKQPKKRGRKKGSKGVDSVIAKETNLTSQMLKSSLGVAGKKVKTTKELYAEMENRKLRSFKAEGLGEMVGNANWTGQQQQQKIVRRISFCSDINESDSCTMTSEPSRDSGNILCKTSVSKSELPIDNNINYSKYGSQFKIGDARNDEGSRQLTDKNTTLEITSKIKSEIQEILKLLTPPPSVKEIEYECFNSITPCTCIIEEVTAPADNELNESKQQNSKDSHFNATNSTNISEKDSNHLKIKIEQMTSAADYLKRKDKDQNDILPQPVPPVKVRKSIFDLDFDDDEDPLHSIIADIEGKNYKKMTEITTVSPPVIDVKSEQPLNSEDDPDQVDHQTPHALNVPAPSSNNIFIPSYKVKFDPDCKAKNRFEIQTQKITKFHIDNLHNCFIPNVNGNWNHADDVSTRDREKDEEFILDGYNVVPLYCSDVNEQIPKDLSNLKFTKKFKVKHSECQNKNEILFYIPFLGVSRILDVAGLKLNSKDINKLTDKDEEKENFDDKLNLNNEKTNLSALDTTAAKEKAEKEMESVNNIKMPSNTIKSKRNKYLKKSGFKRTKRHATSVKRTTIKRPKLNLENLERNKIDSSDLDNHKEIKVHGNLFYHEEICPVVRRSSHFYKEYLFHISSCSSGSSSADEDTSYESAKCRQRTTLPLSSPSSSSSEYHMLNFQQEIIQAELAKRAAFTVENNIPHSPVEIASSGHNVYGHDSDSDDLPEKNNHMLLSFNNIYKKFTRDENTEQQNKDHENNMLKQQLQNCDDYNNLNNNFNLIKYIDNKTSSFNNINNNNTNSCSNYYSDTNINISSSSCSHLHQQQYYKNDNNVQIKPFKEYQTGIRAVDEDVNDDDGNNCGRLQKFKEWHEVLQLRSYNDELLTVLPYVVLE